MKVETTLRLPKCQSCTGTKISVDDSEMLSYVRTIVRPHRPAVYGNQAKSVPQHTFHALAASADMGHKHRHKRDVAGTNSGVGPASTQRQRQRFHHPLPGRRCGRCVQAHACIVSPQVQSQYMCKREHENRSGAKAARGVISTAVRPGAYAGEFSPLPHSTLNLE